MPAGLISESTLRARLIFPQAALRIAHLAMLNRAERALPEKKSALGEAYSSSVNRPTPRRILPKQLLNCPRCEQGCFWGHAKGTMDER